MSDRADPDWRNHAHWDHGSAEPAPTRTDRFLAALAPRLRRAHLPRHPGTSLWLIAVGVCHFVLVGDLLVELVFVAAGSNRALVVVAWVLLVVLVLPGVWLAATGVWDLVRGPLRHFAPRWFGSRSPAD